MALNREKFHMGLGTMEVGSGLSLYIGGVGVWGQMGRVLGVNSRSKGLRTAGLNLSSQYGIYPPLSASDSLSQTAAPI